MPLGIASTFGNPSLDILRRGKLNDPHRYLYYGKAIDERGYHVSADAFGDRISAVLVENVDGFALACCAVSAPGPAAGPVPGREAHAVRGRQRCRHCYPAVPSPPR